MKKIPTALLVLGVLLLLCSCDSGRERNIDSTPAISPSAASASPSGNVLPTTSSEYEFTRENFPVMDGSTSMVPLGQAIASVLLGEPREQVAELAVFNKTTQSFTNLKNGLADILVVGEPNPEVFNRMKTDGFEYDMAPIAMDALVFVVNATNPVENLTTEQLQKIYTGEIKNWKEVGGDDVAIEAFQRNEDAGSQALMKKHVMGGLIMTDPPQSYMIAAMSELITAVKNFDGSAAAIGYTVYYYADSMKMADGLKIIAVDGVAPNDETIAGGAYPFLNPYYTVISAKEPANSPARILFNWLVTPEGQKLIKAEGYVPVGKAAG